MHPIIFQFGPITVYSYGLLVALGFIIPTLLASRQAAQFNIPQDRIINLSLVLLVSGIIGARLLYVLLNIGDFVSNPLEVFMVTHGGLIFYGGAISAFIAGIIYIKRAGLSILGAGDLLAPYIALGHSIGRIGCLLNGCCYGRPASGPFVIAFQDGITRVPTQILSSLLLLLLYMLLRVCLRFRRFKGQVFFLYLCLYPAGRFFIEGLRGDNAPIIFNITFSQMVSIVIFVVGIASYFTMSFLRKQESKKNGAR